MGLDLDWFKGRARGSGVLWLLLALAGVYPRSSQAAPKPDEAEITCRQHLRLQAEAIAAYRHDHQGAFPNGLGDLYPDYVEDRQVLQCPAAVAGGPSGIADLNLVDPSLRDARVIGYGYEFSTEGAIGWASWQFGMSFAEFKAYQRGSLIGQYVPVVRCTHHGTNRTLNLTANGMIYESRVYWESKFVDILPTTRLYPLLVKTSGQPMAALVAPRPPGATPSMLDLRSNYNARFEDPWALCDTKLEPTHFIRDRDQSGGLIRSDGVAFDAAGIIQLGGRIVPEEKGATWYGFTDQMYPSAVRGITVGRLFRTLHVLGAVLFEDAAGVPAANIMLHRSGADPETWTWRYGEDVLAYRFVPGTAEPELKTTVIAWKGVYARPQPKGEIPRLFHLKYANPKPDQLVTHIDFIAAEGIASPFITAITLE